MTFVPSEDSDKPGHLGLRWVHMPFCWFCHEAAHLSSGFSLEWLWHSFELSRWGHSNEYPKHVFVEKLSLNYHQISILSDSLQSDHPPFPFFTCGSSEAQTYDWLGLSEIKWLTTPSSQQPSASYLYISWEREVFSEWMTLKPIVCQNSPQVGMVREVNTKHIPNL